MAKPKKVLPIPLMTRQTAMATGDIMLLTRLTDPPDDYENFGILYEDFLAGIPTGSSSSVSSELTFKDGLALEFFEDYATGAITSFDKGYGWSGNGVGSGTTIVTRTGFGNTNPAQKRLGIISGGYARKFAWGDSWNRIQIAVLWRLNSVAATFGPSGFYFGICSGTANPANSAGTL